ncbi:MAG: hypothetical protein J0G36_11145 [Afipia sp.]|nr:hypothetical protein [Afipia sp.]
MVFFIVLMSLVSIVFSAGHNGSRALVTLAIGDRYRDMFERHCRSNWSAYAERHGCDLIVIDTPIDRTERAFARSLHWQKCLILEHEQVENYRQVAWVDGDIVINPSAPSIFDNVDDTKIGAVDEFGSPDPATYRRSLASLYLRFQRTGVPFVRNLTPEEFYRNRGLPEHREVVQTGVLVCSPQYHREVLRKVYECYEENAMAASNAEMAALSHEILSRNLITWIDPRFNYQVLIGAEQNRIENVTTLRTFRDPAAVGSIIPILKQLLDRAYFLHFAGCQALMSYLEWPSSQSDLSVP